MGGPQQANSAVREVSHDMTRHEISGHLPALDKQNDWSTELRAYLQHLFAMRRLTASSVPHLADRRPAERIQEADRPGLQRRRAADQHAVLAGAPGAAVRLRLTQGGLCSIPAHAWKWCRLLEAMWTCVTCLADGSVTPELCRAAGDRHKHPAVRAGQASKGADVRHAVDRCCRTCGCSAGFRGLRICVEVLCMLAVVELQDTQTIKPCNEEAFSSPLQVALFPPLYDFHPSLPPFTTGHSVIWDSSLEENLTTTYRVSGEACARTCASTALPLVTCSAVGRHLPAKSTLLALGLPVVPKASLRVVLDYTFA